MRVPALSLLVVLALGCGSCRKPAPLGHAASPPAPSADKATDTPSLEGWYLALGNTADRFDAINSFADAPPAVAVAVISRLVALEKNLELRVAMVELLPSFDGEVEGRLAIVGAILGRAGESPEMREAAVTTLEQVDDKRAIRVWETLKNDADAGLRELAEARIEELRE